MRLSQSLCAGLAVITVAGCGPSVATGTGPAGADAAPKKSPLYVSEGAHVSGYGVVVSDKGETRLCGAPSGNAEGGPVTYPSRPCPDGVLLRGFSTSDLIKSGSVLAGNAQVNGVWHAGGVDVASQSPTGQPEPLEPIASDTTNVPCPEPSGGWADVRSFPQEDYPAGVAKLREQHPDDALGGAVVAPTDQQRVMGFAAADADAAKRITDALTPTYGTSICVVVSPYSPTDYRRAARGATHIFEVREPEFADNLTMVVRWFAIVVDDDVQAALDQLPEGLIRLNSILKPTAASGR